MSSTTLDTGVTYTEDDMKTLKEATHIRQNPAMYLGSTDTEGLHSLVYEIVYNSVDEALEGFCRNINVVINLDGSITISDDGRGISIETNVATGKSKLEEALTIVGYSTKKEKVKYRVSDSFLGMGATVVNALSEWCRVEVRRNGRITRMDFSRGRIASALQDLGPMLDDKSGTRISFKPDAEIFESVIFDYDKLAYRLQRLAFLNRGLSISIQDERDGRHDTFKFDEGILEYVRLMMNGASVEHNPLFMRVEHADVIVEVAVVFQKSSDDRFEMCFVNSSIARNGGTPLEGLRRGIGCAIRKIGHTNSDKDNTRINISDLLCGMIGIVNIFHPNPSWEGATRSRINNRDLVTMVKKLVCKEYSDYLLNNPGLAETLCMKGIAQSIEREAYRSDRKKSQLG